MTPYCEDCGVLLNITEEDSRQEWYQATYQCPDCGKEYTHYRAFDQQGRIITDEFGAADEG